MASCIPREEGPVLSLKTKRLRALRKKLNRITQMEDNILSLNKEQEDVKSKPSIVVAIDELEKLKSPLSLALHQHIKQPLPKFKEEENGANLPRYETTESLYSPTEEPQKGESGSETSTEVAIHKEQPPKEDQNHKVAEKEQHSVPWRNYRNQRSGYAAGNGCRGYPNGRRGGSRGGEPYQNGDYNQYYDQLGDYSQRSHQYNRERDGRGGGNYYQNYVPKAQASHVRVDS